ncbi:DUF456 domain-containing protein [Paenibacillus crassostreae]|uniref:DUF456 domain-containing protein n=1 Tax=Paenibacillus crassostreae TaxID=1763538 RepID=A0A167GQY5_9BACL|nr:DUF456 domain-containing protein [Paenibacillus crassostreae]AOZ92014.1 hypothetical protein LPB68_07115 [Paenibacillus crassostreae]OAB77822.1 hypothetical protein PNBC_00195 [Paenibacillus crassostreae]
MSILGWSLIIILFVVGLAGAIFPILPGALAIYLAFFVYGWFFSFESFGAWFWIIQTLIVVVLFVADYVVGAWGTKKYGGSRLSVILSTIGVIIGPFAIPAFGLVIGPFLGAFIGELLSGSNVSKSAKVGWGSLVGLFSSMVMKVILQIGMIVIFFIWIMVN